MIVSSKSSKRIILVVIFCGVKMNPSSFYELHLKRWVSLSCLPFKFIKFRMNERENFDTNDVIIF